MSQERIRYTGFAACEVVGLTPRRFIGRLYVQFTANKAHGWHASGVGPLAHWKGQHPHSTAEEAVELTLRPPR